MTETNAMDILGFTQEGPNPRFGILEGIIFNRDRHQANELEISAILTLCELWGYTYEEYQ